MMAEPQDILIVGGGIGGLVAALTLHQGGHRVRVAEAAAEIRPLGVGINLLSHAVAILDGLGLLPALRASGIETSALVFANRFGQPIHRDPRGLEAGASHPQISIHRGALHTILLDAVRTRLGPERILVDHRLTGVEESGERVRARFRRTAGEAFLDADLLVGADGIHSATRAAFYPDEGPPRWNGVMMWRGTTVGAPFLDGRTMVQAGTGDAKFVVYPVSAAHAARGESLINWIADIRRAPKIEGTRAAPSREDWSKPGKIEDLLPVFGSWRFDYLDVPDIIRRADQILEWPMVDRDPLPRWSFSRVTLLGDAAHPMYPIGSNGATQAILDAEALARALAEHEPAGALAAYEAARRPMTAEIVAMNRRQGLDAILDVVEARAPQGFSRIEDVLDPSEIAAIVGGYKEAAGHRTAGR
jgi:2-polyprenyl-6-methoxyphenol hydroxylase-like FAD-dependent oxidoreductase